VWGISASAGLGRRRSSKRIARLLLANGERPCILSRGYARRVNHQGVTVVSDGTRVLAAIDSAGDEPLMLARALPAVPVLVGQDRYLSGALAESRLGATVHILDDGFQHLQLARDLDLLVVDESDLTDRLLPSGRLREPLDAASVADALLTSAPASAHQSLREALGVETLFSLTRAIGAPRYLGSDCSLTPGTNYPVFAVAGIARPERFFNDLKSMGWRTTSTRTFRDHHPFSRADLDDILKQAQQSGAKAVVTTEKDAVRMEHLLGGAPAMPILAIPLQVTIEPAFADWMMRRIAAASATRPGLRA